MLTEISLENVLRRCGDFGRFQLLHYVFLSLLSIGTGVTNYYYVFGVAQPSFRCRLSPLIWPYDDSFEPINETHRELLDSWNLSSPCDNHDGSPCTTYVYDRSVFGRTFTEDANFICGNALRRTWLSTSYQAGGYENKHPILTSHSIFS